MASPCQKVTRSASSVTALHDREIVRIVFQDEGKKTPDLELAERPHGGVSVRGLPVSGK